MVGADRDVVHLLAGAGEEGIKDARANTATVFLLRTGTPVAKVRKHIVENYYPRDFALDEIRPASTEFGCSYFPTRRHER